MASSDMLELSIVGRSRIFLFKTVGKDRNNATKTCSARKRFAPSRVCELSAALETRRLSRPKDDGCSREMARQDKSRDCLIVTTLSLLSY